MLHLKRKGNLITPFQVTKITLNFETAYHVPLIQVMLRTAVGSLGHH